MAARFYALVMLPIILVLYAAAGVTTLARTGFLERKIMQISRDYFDARMSLGRVSVGPLSGLGFHEISILPDGEFKPAFQAEAVYLEFSLSSILSGSFTPKSIVVKRPELLLDQKKSGSFSVQRLLQKRHFEEMMEGEEFRIEKGEREPFTLLITNGLVRMEGEGPLPASIQNYLAPGREMEIHLPAFHWSDPGGEDFRGSFGGYIYHEAVGDLPMEGEVDAEGLVFLSIRALNLDPKDDRFQSFFSEEVRKGIDLTGLTGQVDLRFDAERSGDSGLDRYIYFDGFNLCPDPFPLDFRGVEGRMTLAKEALHLDWAWATALGGRIRCEGFYDFTAEEMLNFILDGKGVPFCPELERGVESIGGGRDYRAFAPLGKADFTFNGRVARSEKRVRGDLIIRPQGASAAYEGYFNPITGLTDAFPYRLHDVRGEIRVYLQDRLEIDAVEGYTRPTTNGDRSADAPVRGRVLIHGQLGLKGSDKPTDFQVFGQDILLDDGIMRAVRAQDPDAADFMDEFDPSGRVNVFVRFHHPAHQYPPPDIFVELEDVSVCYEGFPYPVEHVRGMVRREGDNITFNELSGYRSSLAGDFMKDSEEQASADLPDASSSYLTRGDRSGQIRLDANVRHGRMEKLYLRGFHQFITPKVKESLEGILPEEFLFLTDIEYEGTADFSIRIEDQPPEDIFEVDLNLYMDRVKGGTVPTDLEDLRGSLHLDWRRGALEARNLTVRAGEGQFTFQELKVFRPKNILSVLVKGSGRNLGLDTDLSGILKGRILEDWQNLRCKGGVDLEHLDLSTEIDDEGGLRRMLCDMDIRINGGELAYPMEIKDIHGDLWLHMEKNPGGNDAFEVNGKTKDTSFTLPDERLFTHMETEFHADGSGFTFPRFKGFFYGGRIKGIGENPLHLDFDPPRAFKGNLQMEDADLRHFFDRGSYAARNLAGKVSGAIQFQGEVDNPHRTRASGELYITEGSLFELPVFGDLSRVMGNLFSTEPPTFKGGEAAFELEKGVVTMEKIKLDSTLMELDGSGKLTVDGMDIKFIPSTSFVPNIPIIGDLMDLLKSGILMFKISGPYSNLTVSYENLVNQIFASDDVPDEPRYWGRIGYDFEERF